MEDEATGGDKKRASSGVVADGVDAAAVKKRAKTEQRQQPLLLYLITMLQSLGDPVDPEVVGLYSTKEAAIENARRPFEGRAMSYSNGTFDETNDTVKGREDCSRSLTIRGSERIFLEVTGSLDDFVAVAFILVQSECTYGHRMPMPLRELHDHARGGSNAGDAPSSKTSEDIKGKGSDYFLLTALAEGNMGGEPGDPCVLGVFASKDDAI